MGKKGEHEAGPVSKENTSNTSKKDSRKEGRKGTEKNK
jgi:hypothetical protein